MLPRDLSLAQVARLAATAPVLPVGDPRQQAFQRALAGQLGQTMQADVLARLADGSYVVRVADMAARMPLPAGTQAGAQVPLTLVALQPRPTFQVDPGRGAPVFAEAAPVPPEGAAAQATQAAPLAYLEGKEAAALARNAALLASARSMTGGDAGGSLKTSISPAGKAIGDVLAAAQQAEHPATAAIARTPLLPAATPEPAQLAAALRQGLERSGLFYESHVAEWAQGSRPLAELAQEPQARGAMPSAVAPDTAQFINLQLGAQEQGRVAWQGQLWPGQDLHWEIERRAARDDGVDADAEGARPDSDAAPHWHSRLRLRFGALGEVDARIVLAGDRVHLRLDAAPDAATRMRDAQERLADALDVAGTPLASLAIRTPPAAPEDGTVPTDGHE